MRKEDLQINSTDIQKLLTVATSGESLSAQQLQRLMGSKYEVILTLIQQKPELSSFVVNFMVQGKLAKRRIVKFSSLVLEHLEGKNEDKSDELDLFDESMDESSHGTKKLGKYAREIKKLYVGGSWVRVENLNILVATSEKFLDNFLSFYGQEDIEGEEIGDGTIKLKKKKGKKKKNEDFSTDSANIQKADMMILDVIIQMICSYISVLERSEDPKDLKILLKKEEKNGRWHTLNKLVQRVKVISLNYNIMEEMGNSDFDLSTTIQQTLVTWDSYSIQLNNNDEET